MLIWYIISFVSLRGLFCSSASQLKFSSPSLMLLEILYLLELLFYHPLFILFKWKKMTRGRCICTEE